ncbi:MAG: SpoIIE family protein phosphatase [Chloroflexota bacterium]|nr:SpoIIE family protein phosphatase [Chloroflexota bacterium]
MKQTVTQSPSAAPLTPTKPRSFWQWLGERTQPSNILTDAEDRRRARLLAAISGTLAVILTLAFFISVTTSTLFPNPEVSLGLAGTLVVLAGALGFWIAYFLSITPRYKTGAIITIIVICGFLSGFIYLPQYARFSTELVLGYAVPVLLATIFLNSQGTIRVFIVGLALTIFALLYQGVLVVSFAFIIGIVLTVMLLVVLVALLREQDLKQVQRLRELEAQDAERLHRELDLARNVQQAMLPQTLPNLPNIDLAAFSQPAFEASGDFYDVFMIAGGGSESHKIGIAVCDVAGKGISSALVMSATRAALRAEAENTESPARVLSKVNEMLAASLPSGLFVTLFYGVYDINQHHLVYSSGGHPHPYRYSNGAIQELESYGMPLGLLAESEYQDVQVTLVPGECIYIYTDGLVEALNARREMYGFETVRDNVALHAERTQDANTLLTNTITDMKTFLAGEHPHDDVTVVVLRTK